MGSGRGRSTSGERLTRAAVELHAQLLTLASCQALQHTIESPRIDLLARAQLSDSRLALGLDGYLLAIRRRQSGRLEMATADGVSGALCLELVARLSRLEGDATSTPLVLSDLKLNPGPLLGLEPPLEGSLAVLPLRAANRSLGFLVLFARRPNGIGDSVQKALAATAADLAAVIDAAVDNWSPSDLEDHATLPVLQRRQLLSRLGAAVERAQAQGKPLSLVIIHIDDLRRILEQSGTAAGVDALGAIVTSLRGLLRATDAVARLEGGLICACLHDCNRAGALSVADKLSRAAARMPTDPNARVAISVGAGTLGRDEDGVGLLAAVEACLDEAIAAGGGRIVARPDQADPSQ